MRRFVLLVAVAVAALLSLPGLAQDIITTAIGGGPNNIPALDANLYTPYGVAVDSSGNLSMPASFSWTAARFGSPPTSVRSSTRSRSR